MARRGAYARRGAAWHGAMGVAALCTRYVYSHRPDLVTPLATAVLAALFAAAAAFSCASSFARFAWKMALPARLPTAFMATYDDDSCCRVVTNRAPDEAPTSH